MLTMCSSNRSIWENKKPQIMQCYSMQHNIRSKII